MKRRSLQIRLVKNSILLLLTAMVAIFSLNYFLIQLVLPHKSNNLRQALTDRINQNVLFILQTSDYTYEQMKLDQSFMSALETSSKEDERRRNRENTISAAVLNFSQDNAGYISDMILFSDGSMYASSTNIFQDIKNIHSLQKYLDDLSQSPVSMTQLSDSIPGIRKEARYLSDKIVVLHQLFDLKGEPVARVLFILRDDAVDKLLRYSNIAIYDNMERLLFANVDEGLLESAHAELMSGETLSYRNVLYSTSTTTLEQYGWKIVSLVPMEWFHKLISRSIKDIFTVALSTAFVIAVLIWILSKSMNKKISHIVKGFESTTGEQFRKIYPLTKNRWSHFRKFGFQQKINIYFYCTVFLPLFLLSLFSNNLINMKINEQNEIMIHQIAELDSQNVENFIYKYNRAAALLSSSYNVRRFLYSNLMGEMPDYEQYRELSYTITGIFSELCSSPALVRLVDHDGALLYQNADIYPVGALETKNSTVTPGWTSQKFMDTTYLSVICHSYGYEGQAISLGDCEIILPMETLMELFGPQMEELQYVQRETGKTLTPLSPLRNNQPAVGIIMPIDETMLQVNYNPHAYKDIDILMGLSYSSFLLLLLLAVNLLSKHVSKGFINKIDELNGLYHEIGQTDQIVYSKLTGEDELDVLVRGFNTMAERLNWLIQEVYETKIAEKQLELDALQEQINPHFLFNTLETINALVELQDQRATQMVSLLSSFFRMGISRGSRIVSLQEEIEYTQIYTEILKIRLGDAIEFCLPDAAQYAPYSIPRIILQPLIENSIKHGMKLVPKGSIQVIVHFINDELHLIVKDTGSGMTAQQLTRVREKLLRGGAGGIGLKNVHDRIRMQYGERYGLCIYSAQNRGTVVVAHIPITHGRS